MVNESVIQAVRRMAETELRGGEPAPSVEGHLRTYLKEMGASELERDVLALSAVRAAAAVARGRGREIPS